MVAWRTVRYGPLKPLNLATAALTYLPRKSKQRLFWELVGSREVGFQYGVLSDRNGTFVIKFHTKIPICVEFCNIQDLVQKMKKYSLVFESGRDFQELYKRDPDPNHWYLDMSSSDALKLAPTPMHIYEEKNNPEWVGVVHQREEIAKKYFDDEELEYFSHCHNTFDVHAIDWDAQLASGEISQERYDEIMFLRNEKYDGLASLWDLDETLLCDDAFDRVLAKMIMDESELTTNYEVVDLTVDFSCSELLMMGCRNSARGGLTFEPAARDTKASTNYMATVEALDLIREGEITGVCKIRPHTMNPKDERNKPGKKEKMFNMLDHPYQKLDLLFNGNVGDRRLQNLQSGNLTGISCNGQGLDESLRICFGISLGTGRLTDDELRDVKCIQSDFASFEMRLLKDALLCMVVARVGRYGNGVYSTGGGFNRGLGVALVTNAERKLLPDLRVSGTNVTYTGVPMQISGEPWTLTNNSVMHGAMVFSAQMEYQCTRQVFDPRYASMLTSTPKVGDDGIYPAEPFVEDVLDLLTKMEPVAFKIEKRGWLISDIQNARHNPEREGVDFCKQNFVLESGHSGRTVVTLQRHFKNLYKIPMGNRSTIHPGATIAALKSQTANCYGNSRYYGFCKELHAKLVEMYGEMGYGETEDREQSAIDGTIKSDRFPTEVEVRQQLYVRDGDKIHTLHRSLYNHYAYQCPVKGVSKGQA